MKKIMAALILSIIASFAVAQDGQALYGALSGSIVYLQHGIRVSAEDSANPELWKRFEEIIKRPLLDTVLPIMSGSGFFVDDDGYIVTNRHVAKLENLQAARNDEVQSMSSALDEYYSYKFTAEERRLMKADFATMIEEGEYSFEAIVGSKSLGPVAILALSEEGEEEPDLALVKAGGGPYKAIRLASSDSIGQGLVGADVFSLGYPLGSYLDAIFKERAVTMNRGTVSAVRKAVLSLQHSAAISHGNSGGPLVNGQGLVLGVNTGSLQEREGNSLFYAIDSLKVLDFLKANGFERVVKWNQRIPSAIAAGSSLKTNVLGELETSANVIVDVDKDVAVVLDGKKIGSGPSFLNLTNPLSALELHGPKGDFYGKLRLVSTLSGSTTLKPALGIAQVPVIVRSNPSGAMVIVDGKKLGPTPMVANLSPDTYLFHLEQEGRWFADVSAEVRLVGDNSLSFGGEVAYPVSFGGLPAEPGLRMVFSSNRGKASFSKDEKAFLPSGDWAMTMEGSDAFAGVSIPISVKAGPATVDLSPFRKLASLKIIGLDPKAKLWLDGKPFLDFSGNTLQLPLGLHTVSLWEDGRQPLESTAITVREGNKSFLIWDRQVGHDTSAAWFGWGGAGVAAAGATLAGLGYYYGQNSVLVPSTNSYAEYTSQKSQAGLELLAGSALVAGAIVLEVIAIGHGKKLKAQKKIRDSLEAQK